MSEAIIAISPQASLADGLSPRTIQELLAFIGVSDKRKTGLPERINDLFKQVGSLAESLVLDAIEKRTAADFLAVADGSFNAYVRVLRIKSDLLQVILGNDTKKTERLVTQSLTELEGEFRNNGIKMFGGEASEQAIFTLWTRRKTAAQVWRLFGPLVSNSTLNESLKPKADQLGLGFAIHSAWAQFHLDCLATSMRLDRPVYPDVLPSVIDGLRSEVNAFALAKELVNLHIPPGEDTPLVKYVWDDEDDELLASSMHDMEAEEI